MAELEVTDLEADDTTFDGHGAPPASDAPSPQGDIQQLPPAAARDERQRQPTRRPSKGQMGEPPLRGPSPRTSTAPTMGGNRGRGARPHHSEGHASGSAPAGEPQAEHHVGAQGGEPRVLRGVGADGAQGRGRLLVVERHRRRRVRPPRPRRRRRRRRDRAALPAVRAAEHRRGGGERPVGRVVAAGVQGGVPPGARGRVRLGRHLRLHPHRLLRQPLAARVTCANVGGSSAYLVPYELLEAPPAGTRRRRARAGSRGATRAGRAAPRATRPPRAAARRRRRRRSPRSAPGIRRPCRPTTATATTVWAASP